MLYLCLKYLHVIAAIFLFGFGMGSYLYLIAASRSGNPQVIAHVARMVVRFDTWITTPAGIVRRREGRWVHSFCLGQAGGVIPGCKINV